jgi:phosphoribosylaminoimidazole-succinocarboxamide synthase
MVEFQKSVIRTTNFNFSNLQSVYHGKVRDVYNFGDQIALIATDRISAFDVILPKPIPFKGQILNKIASFFLVKTRSSVNNWFIASPDPNVTFGLNAKTYPVEIVVRAYLTGHAWRTYKAGLRMLCGVVLPEGLNENDALPFPIITPTTKATEGHDEDISREEIINSGLVCKTEYEIIETKALTLFAIGTEMAKQRGLILVDTKYEFGKYQDEIIVIDEIHTPDSSRYFYSDTYTHLQNEKLPQRQLSKEFVREWLIENGFQGKEGQVVPLMTDDFVSQISNRYIELYEIITGEKFEKIEEDNIQLRIEKNINTYISKIL